MTALVWFRRDLRVHDHPALRAALDGNERVVPVFCFDDRLLHGRHASGPRTQFLLECLADLDAALADRGAGLVVRNGPPERELVELAREVGATAAHFTRDVSPFARARGELTRGAFADAGLEVHAHPGLNVLDEPAGLRTQAGKPYTVFTPYCRSWDQGPRREVLGAPRRIALPSEVRKGAIPRRASSRPGCRTERAPRPFGVNSAGATSTTSSCTTIRPTRSPSSRSATAGRSGGATPSGPSGRGQRGARTGYPLVDAGMRQLRHEGWMHNRARLVVGSFLTKDLGIDWRWGERWVMRLLIDGDEANNNGNWQWIASVGADPAPVFRRIYNPARHMERYDPRGEYVRRYVTELRAVPDEHLREPWEMPEDVQREVGCVIGRDYPEPIVDHAQARREALERYASARSG